ncbi:hypothetical protein V6N13_134316 [Hibiscus sabdariffa]
MRDQDAKGSDVIVSLFVENLSERLHWMGLWHSFARHGDVVNVYIARKRTRGGKRFRFVRMKNMEEAYRAIERLHGFHLYGSKLLVKVASKSSVWMGSSKDRFYTERVKQYGRRVKDSLEDVSVEERTYPKPTNTKRFIGHIENEELWQLRKCLVGVMESVCSVRSIHDRLMKWGLGDVNV